VAAADAERRRIERDLHDGAQQRLVTLAVKLGIARDAVTAEPPRAVALLDGLAGEVREAVQEVRDLAHGVYPPLLADAGLAEAVRAAVARSPARASLEVPPQGVGRGPAEIEAAVYFCCLEALQNAAKHAEGSEVRMRLWRSDDALCFEVADDGPGFDPAVTTGGHGLQNIADRLGAVGGKLGVDAGLGRGTRIYGKVPWT
jgi:signal transduction histidine kinase